MYWGLVEFAVWCAVLRPAYLWTMGGAERDRDSDVWMNHVLIWIHRGTGPMFHAKTL